MKYKTLFLLVTATALALLGCDQGVSSDSGSSSSGSSSSSSQVASPPNLAVGTIIDFGDSIGKLEINSASTCRFTGAAALGNGTGPISFSGTFSYSAISTPLTATLSYNAPNYSLDASMAGSPVAPLTGTISFSNFFGDGSNYVGAKASGRFPGNNNTYYSFNSQVTLNEGTKMSLTYAPTGISSGSSSSSGSASGGTSGGSGSGGVTSATLVGTWNGNNQTFIFNSNGSGKFIDRDYPFAGATATNNFTWSATSSNFTYNISTIEVSGAGEYNGVYNPKDFGTPTQVSESYTISSNVLTLTRNGKRYNKQ